MTAARRIQVLIGLFIALALPFCHLGDLGKAHSGLGPLWGGEVLWWALFLFIVFYVLVIERRTLSSIGFRPPGAMDLTLGFVFAVVVVFGTGFIFSVLLPALHLSLAQKINALFQAPFWFRVLLVTRAAFVEEIAFRGYGFERLTEFSGSKWLAALITCGLFTLAHYSGGGWGQVIVAAWGGVALTALYLWRRNLWANILCHWLIDGAGFLLMPMVGGHHH